MFVDMLVESRWLVLARSPSMCFCTSRELLLGGNIMGELKVVTECPTGSVWIWPALSYSLEISALFSVSSNNGFVGELAEKCWLKSSVNFLAMSLPESIFLEVLPDSLSSFCFLLGRTSIYFASWVFVSSSVFKTKESSTWDGSCNFSTSRQYF